METEADGDGAEGDFDPDQDDLLADAIATVVQMGTASTSMLQRRLRVGYTRAGRLIDMMERRGVISGYEGSKARQVLITEADLPRVLEQLAEPAVASPADGLALPTRMRRAGCRTIGDTLREARMRQHLDIADVEARTKIRAKYLRALENEEFGMLPGPTFVKTLPAHLRRGARASTRRCWSRSTGGLRVARRGRAPAAARARPRVAARAPPAAAGRPPRGPWLLIGAGAWWRVIGVLLVIGLVGGDDEGGGGARAGRRPSTHDRAPSRSRRPSSRSRPPPRDVALRVVPDDADLRLRRHRARHRRRLRGHHLRAADVPRPPAAGQPRQDRRAADGERQAGADRAGPGPGRLRVHARARPSRCPLGERPCA